MARWFRHYAGMMSDPKFGGVARRCCNVAGTRKVSRADVLFVWGCILESAAERNSAEFDWDADAVADLLDCDTDIAQRIHDELEKSGLIEKGRITKWDERQFVSDSSTERSRKHRATLQQRCATPPETETYTDTKTETEKKEFRAREEIRDAETQPIHSKAVSEKSKGTRWHPDNVVPEDWIEAACEARAKSGLGPIDMRHEVAKFSHYWTSSDCPKPMKKDWRQTFIKWAVNSKGTSNGHGGSERKSALTEAFGELYATARAQREARGD